MDVRKEMDKITDKIMGLQYYNTYNLVTQLGYWIGQLEYFYNELVDKQTPNVLFPDPSKVYFHPKQRPKEGQIAYFNLTYGFPKELYSGHYCYIVKDYGSQLVIIPTTSVKPTSAPCNKDYEFDILVKDFVNMLPTRMQITHIRSVDLQRLNPSKGFFDVTTPRTKILGEIQRIIF